MQDKLVPQQFMLLNKEMRDKLASVFKLKKSGITEILDQSVVRDGHTEEDLSNVTIDSMQEYTGSKETSFGKLWELTVSKTADELYPQVIVPAQVVVIEKGTEKEESISIKESVNNTLNIHDTKKNTKK